MICEKILGMLDELDVAGKTVEYVEIEWHEAFKKIHKKTTDTGREVGIRMDDSVLTEGLYDGKVIYMDDGLVIAVHTPPCEVIRVTVKPDHRFMAAKVCYEIGNRHAPLFYGEDEYTFITPYNEPMLQMLSGLHGVEAEKEMRKLAFDKRVSASDQRFPVPHRRLFPFLRAGDVYPAGNRTRSAYGGGIYPKTAEHQFPVYGSSGGAAGL